MELGVHLPLIGFGGERWTLDRLLGYVRAARELGFRYLTANDHIVFSAPWLDGPTALAATLTESQGMTLMTTVALPAIRGPAQLARTAAAIDLLSGGRLILGVGPGSSTRDYEAAGVPFEERWKRLDEAVQALRAYWRDDGRFSGHFYSALADLRPLPARPGGPPIWIGSWGSEAGIRRVARLADGWLASAYNTTPNHFAEALAGLRARLAAIGKDPAAFPNAVATMVFHVTEDAAEATRVLEKTVAPVFSRPLDELRSRFLIGRAEECREKVAALAAAGVQRLFLWPAMDELRQLSRFTKNVAY